MTRKLGLVNGCNIEFAIARSWMGMRTVTKMHALFGPVIYGDVGSLSTIHKTEKQSHEPTKFIKDAIPKARTYTGSVKHIPLHCLLDKGPHPDTTILQAPVGIVLELLLILGLCMFSTPKCMRRVSKRLELTQRLLNLGLLRGVLCGRS